MLDFLKIEEQLTKDGTVLRPKFVINSKTKDLMIRGGDFYAVWDEDLGMWSTDEDSVIRQVDDALNEYKKKFGEARVIVRYMWDSDSKSIDRWHKYVQSQMRDRYHVLDQKLTFSNTEVKKEDYVSKRLPYPLEEGDNSSYDELIGTLYNEENRRKLEWAIGAIVSGDSTHIQKFEVLYGSAGSGKSTILNIIQKLFEGYYSIFDAKALASQNNQFGLQSFKTNPLVSIQHDGDLSKIEDNTKLNSIVSHEAMEVNLKYGRIYTDKFNSFLFMGTNKPVKITEAKSGILRRLIDVRPSGNKIPYQKYVKLMKKIDFELGAIAWHCLKLYEELGENYYDEYVPLDMMSATNDFYDFIEYSYDDFVKNDFVTLTEAWKRYKEYCEYAHAFQLPMRAMRCELSNYFESFTDRYIDEDGNRLRSVYVGFKKEKLESKVKEKKNEGDISIPDWLEFSKQESIFDSMFGSWMAQYEKDYGNGAQPESKWANCKTHLSDIDTSKTHYTKPPDDIPLLMVDFDLRDENGEKDLKLNIKAAALWPETYAELSKSGGGIHLYYFYSGDLSKIARLYSPGIELKVFTGNSAIRRKVSKCNDIPVKTLNSGLPLKGDDRRKMVNWDGIKNEKAIRTMILKNLRKKYHGDTTSSIDYIKKILDDAYDSGMPYDVSDMQHDISLFAINSTNQKDRCVKTVSQMKFKSEDKELTAVDISQDGKPIVIDIEIYPEDKEKGLDAYFLICWKYYGAPDDSIVAMENPKSSQVESLLKHPMIGYNILEYDAPLLYCASMGYSAQKIYDTSYSMINLHQQPPHKYEAKKMVLYDVYEYCKAAGDGKSLKKWEIELGYSHMEMGIPWNEAVPLEIRPKVVEYCKNDVLATEKVYDHTKGYRLARDFQVSLVKALHGDDIFVCTSDTANTLTKRAIFGKEKNPQINFNYRDLSKPVGSDRYEEYLVKFGSDYKFRVWNSEGLPEYRDYIPGEVLPDGYSILPFFPGYVFDEFAPKGMKSKFHEDFGGEGGRTYSKPGMYTGVWDGDIASQYPSSIIAEMLFGPVYTKIFAEIVYSRIAVKHKDYETAIKYLEGALRPFLNDENAKDLAQGLKIIINAVYGLTKASFPNEFKDERNKDNIVAKRGNLFMLVLKEQVEKRGFEVCHIKTDSIKIANANSEIADFVIKFGKEYGYNFETEGEFEKFVLLNDAAYVAYDKKEGWITKAAQFQEPFVKKTLFTKEPVTFDDLCQTFSVQEGAIYLDRNENLYCVDDELEKEIKALDRLRNKFTKHLKNTNPGISDNWITSFIFGEQRAKDYLRDNPDPKSELYLQNIIAQIEKVDALNSTVDLGHNLQFIGRVGRFCPVIDGADGGILWRIQNNKKYAVNGTSGYRWLEAEYILKYGLKSKINMKYFANLVDKAAEAISKYGDLEWFINGDVAGEDFLNLPEGEDKEIAV